MRCYWLTASEIQLFIILFFMQTATAGLAAFLYGSYVTAKILMPETAVILVPAVMCAGGWGVSVVISIAVGVGIYREHRGTEAEES